MTSQSVEQLIQKQRSELSSLLSTPLKKLTNDLSSMMSDRNQLESHLTEMYKTFKHCKNLYVLNDQAIQLTSNITKKGSDESHFNRNRSNRPYIQGITQKEDLYLSDAYISKNRKRPSITAVHKIIGQNDLLLGFLGVDYDLRELPELAKVSKEVKKWQQVKGDPAIRSGLFTQQRIQSQMDNHMDDIFALIEELIIDRGIFHAKFHFSSSRVTIWSADDPYSYQILTLNELIDPDICLIFPRRSYFEKAIVAQDKIMEIFDYFRRLRFADENIYLRAGSLNIVNGMIGLNFSCDGSHYMPYDEFLNQGLGFWFGQSNDLDSIIETICQKGCNMVYQYIDKLQQGIELKDFPLLSKEERTALVSELVNIMDVYKN
ncbi:MAG: PDC sensor domain-containing protein [Gammaproteobacteria bacterium]|nr:PDC sensor domain-containing protein [Gammaproteobacteria bacterium]